MILLADGGGYISRRPSAPSDSILWARGSHPRVPGALRAIQPPAARTHYPCGLSLRTAPSSGKRAPGLFREARLARVTASPIMADVPNVPALVDPATGQTIPDPMAAGRALPWEAAADTCPNPQIRP